MPSIAKKHSTIKRYCSKAAQTVTAVLLCLLFVVLSGCAQGNAPVATAETVGDDAVKQLFLPESNAASLSYLSVSAEAAILIEAQTGGIVWSKNADKILPMASTTKIMTALVAIESADITKTVSVSEDAIGIEGSSVYLYCNERLTLEELLYAMLLESANDAAAAIAIEVGGSISDFAALMNEKAEELGLENTHFTNPHGLDDPEHYTTAHDLAIIARAAMQNERFREIVSTYKRTIPLNETEGVRLLINHNKLLSRYDGAIGIKTGYTKKSGRCLVSAAERDGVEFICVTLNAPNDWNDHINMLDHGFSLYESRLLCEVGGFKRVQTVVGGCEEYMVLTNAEEIRVTVPKDAPQILLQADFERFSYAPISNGDEVGRLIFTLDGKTIASAQINAEYTIERIEYKKSFFEKIFSVFQ